MSREEFQGVKKNLLRTANDYDLESRNMNSTSSNAQTYTLADGHVIESKDNSFDDNRRNTRKHVAAL